MSKTVAKNSDYPASSLYAPDGGRKYLNGFERQRLFIAIATLPTERALFALTLAWTGARISEVLALRASSFQIERGVIAIVTLKRRKYSVREVPVPPSLIAALNREFGIDGAQRDSRQAGLPLWPWHRVTAWRLVKALMQKAGIVGAPACPRGFRHGFGVGTLQAGVPLNIVQRWLGHARLSTTAIYTEAAGPEERAFAARFWMDDGDA